MAVSSTICPRPAHCEASDEQFTQEEITSDVKIMGSTEDVIESTEIIMDTPPSYDSLEDHTKSFLKTAPTLALLQANAFFTSAPLPPTLKYFVKTSKDPSTWKLLSGPQVSNATSQINKNPTGKRRYKIIYPPGYEDVYLHKSAWTAHADALPRYHVELYGRDSYEAEPIGILGPPSEDPELTNEAKIIATHFLGRVFSRVEDEVKRMTRFAMFCEMEYFSWDWRCKSAAARHDMLTLISNAQRQAMESQGLVEKLELYLEFVGREDFYVQVVGALGRRVREARRRLERLRL